jgi:hypothetical protein
MSLEKHFTPAQFKSGDTRYQQLESTAQMGAHKKKEALLQMWLGQIPAPRSIRQASENTEGGLINKIRGRNRPSQESTTNFLEEYHRIIVDNPRLGFLEDLYRERKLKSKSTLDEHFSSSSYYENYEETEDAKRRELKNEFRKASLHDYTNWLIGFWAKGGKNTHIYDYLIPISDWYVAKKDFMVLPLYGSNSIEIIVPEGINFLGGELGHNNLFFEDGFRASDSWIPFYTPLKRLPEVRRALEITGQFELLYS